MNDHIKAARSIWGENAILPFDELERFWAIAHRAGMERASEICTDEGLYCTAHIIRAEAHAQNQPKNVHDGSVV